MATVNNTRGAVAPYGYFMDDGKEVIVHLTESVAQAGGFTAASSAAVSRWAGKQTHLRHFDIVSTAAGKVFRDRIPAAKPSDAHYIGTTKTINFNGRAWRVTGRIGEKLTY